MGLVGIVAMMRQCVIVCEMRGPRTNQALQLLVTHNTLEGKERPFLFPNDICAPFTAHPHFMPLSSLNVDPCARPKCLFSRFLVVGILDCELPAQDEMRGQSTMAMGRVICIARYIELSCEFPSSGRGNAGSAPPVGPGKNVLEAPGGDLGLGFCAALDCHDEIEIVCYMPCETHSIIIMLTRMR